MGNSKSSLGSQRRLPSGKKERTEFVVHKNKYGDDYSDYDDEEDSEIPENQEDASDISVRQAPAGKPSLHAKDGREHFPDYQQDGDPEKQERQGLLENQRVFQNVDSVNQLDKVSSVASVRPGDQSPKGSASRPVSGQNVRPGSRYSHKSGGKSATVVDEKPPLDPNRRDPRTHMDPQSRKALDADIKRLRDLGDMKFNMVGLLSFNRFMHLFILITRHSKEQFIKEQRKVVDKRRRAFRLKAWGEYSTIVQYEIDMERLKYLDVLNYILNDFEIPDGCYRASFVKYSMNRDRDLQMKDARQLVLKDVENRHIESIEFNEEMIDKEECVKIMGFYEARKLDVLSILSNPFKHQFDNKEKFVLELAVEQAKIEDQIYLKFGKEFMTFIKACKYYGLMKSGKGKTDLHKDALVIGNNLNVNLDF